MTALQALLGGAHVLLALFVSAHIVPHQRRCACGHRMTGLVWLHPGGGLGAVWVVRDQSDPSSGRDASQGRPLADSRTAELAATQESTALVPTRRPAQPARIATVVGRATASAHRRQLRRSAGERRSGLSRHARGDRWSRAERGAGDLHLRPGPGRRPIRGSVGPRRGPCVEVRVLIDGVGAR